ncbi:MAG TPA: ATP-binding protein [Candidatus Wallbacteria bacterium]|nr:ATP-binding protein [Candidatus Wallbacteria bacterium]
MPIKRKLIIIIGASLILMAALSSYYINAIINESDHLNFLSTARAFFQQIQLTRSWVAMQGGVFIEKKDGVSTNPYLMKIKDLKYDIKDQTGTQYTLENPALVTRQISELAETSAMFKFHITSLKLINPANAPDAFEKSSLKLFEEGKKENYEYMFDENGEAVNFRYMAPLFIEKSCLKCHEEQNYKIGEVRGGISVTIPADKTTVASANTLKPIIATWLVIILMIIIIIYYTFKHLIINPIDRLAGECERVSAGDYSKSIATAAPENDEIGKLSAAFEKMRATAYDYMSGLEKKVNERTAELLEAQKKATEAKNAAESASRAKSDFLAMMSHEIRTPLNAVIGFSDMLEATGLTADQAEMLGYVKNSGQFLAAIINDILDFSKIEAGKLELEKIVFSLQRLIDETLAIVNVSSVKKGITLNQSIDPRIAFYLKGDANRLKQILLNLLGNSVKFTAEGEVLIRAELVSETQQKAAIFFEVADEGADIPEDKIEKIFSPFNQADPSVTRIYGGTGLGLAISNKLVKLMGGEKIFVKSELGRGSKFHFTIEFDKDGDGGRGASAAENVFKPGETKIKYKLLLAEDNLMNLKLASKLLTMCGHEVKTAENGRLAYEMACAENFDAVLMDIQMPVLDGFEASKMIRAAGIGIPIIALTASAIKSDLEESVKCGMDDYITKPINARNLEPLIAGIIEKKKAKK